MKSQNWLMIALASIAAACAPMQQGSPAPDVASPRLIVRDDRLFVPARVNGVDTVALLDSAAEMSFMDKAFAEEVGLTTAGNETARGTGGEEEVTFAQGVTIEAAGVTLSDQTVAVLDLSDISTRLIGSPLSIVIGRQLFDAARLYIDIEEGQIISTERKEQPRGVRLPMETHKGLQTIPVSVEGGEPVQADFDLGNGTDVLIGAAYAERIGLNTPERIVGKKPGGGIGGEVERDFVILNELEIAGVVFENVEASIDRTGNAADVNVGVRILRNFRMTVDFAENALWLEKR